MNFPRVPNFLGFARKKEKEEDVGLEQVTTSQQDQQHPLPSPDGSPVREPSTAVQRRGKEKVEDEENRLGEVIIPQQPGASSSSRVLVITVVPSGHRVVPRIGRVKETESESSSSSSTSIEDILQRRLRTDSDEFRDTFETRSPPSDPAESQTQQEPTENPPLNQQPTQQLNLEEIINVPSHEDENGEVNEFILENLQPTAAENNGDHISIDLDDVGVGESAPVRNPTYLETYLEIMYTCGLSPFLPDGATGGIWGYCQKACLIQVVNN